MLACRFPMLLKYQPGLVWLGIFSIPIRPGTLGKHLLINLKSQSRKRPAVCERRAYIIYTGCAGHSISGAMVGSMRFACIRYFFQALSRSISS